MRFARAVDHDRHEEGGVVRHVHHPPRREVPLAAKVPFRPLFRVRRYDRQEEGAFVDLLADLGVPGIAPAQGVLVQPHVDAAGAQPLGDANRCRGILGRIGDEDGARRPVGARGFRVFRPVRGRHKTLA